MRMPPEDESVQLHFDDGQLVEGPDRGPPVEPGSATGFTLEVRDGALAVNDRLDGVRSRYGRQLAFGSRRQAETYAAWLSTGDGSVTVQAAPEGERRDVDAYLLAAHSPSVTTPAAVAGDRWEFDVDANLYGALGEALLLEAPKPYALSYFVREDLGIEEPVHLDVQRAPTPTAATDVGWIPDCEVLVRTAPDGPVRERYVCEIKTGGGTLERGQRPGMEALARSERVLLVRVDIEDLPERYAVTISEVEPGE